MALKHAVLGMLVDRENYGHRLTVLLQRRLGPGFAVDSGTVYASLRNLEREGHVYVTRRETRGGQIRVYYRASPGGLDHFEEWMDGPLSREPLRGEMFLRFAMADVDRAPRLKAAFERLERECLNEIALHTITDLAGTVRDPVSWVVASRLLLDSGQIDRLNAELSFIKRTLSVLRWAEDQGIMPAAMLMEVVEASAD